MITVHRGVDGLDLAIKAHIPTELAQKLKEAQEEAKRANTDHPLDWNGQHLSVAQTGAKGGYAFRCGTGPIGGTWFFKEPNPADPWGIRLSVNSMPLATRGLEWVRKDIERVLDALGVGHEPTDISISRVDFAFDVLAPGFSIDRNALVLPAQSRLRAHEKITDVIENGHSGRTTSLTAGMMPNRQVILYDKREEVLARKKRDWFLIWNGNLAQMGRPPLDERDPNSSRVWRVELRAGKNHLRKGWHVRGWRSLYEALPRFLECTLSDVRYTTPRPDRNRSRWPNHPLWDHVREELAALAFDIPASVPVAEILRCRREEKIAELMGQMAGLAIAVGVLEGQSMRTVGEAVESMGPRLTEHLRDASKPLPQRIAAATARYHWFLPEKGV